MFIDRSMKRLTHLRPKRNLNADNADRQLHTRTARCKNIIHGVLKKRDVLNEPPDLYTTRFKFTLNVLCNTHTHLWRCKKMHLCI